MKIGILNADTISPDWAEKYGQYPEMFSKVFWDVNSSIKFKTYEVQNDDFPQNINECDAYLVTGSKADAYADLPWILNLKQFVRTLNNHHKKIIGICFGHQLIAEALGGKVKKSKNGWHVGVDLLKFNTEISDYGKPGEEIKLIFSHQDEVATLPQTAKLLAGSQLCPNGMFIMNNVICFQGHIEFSPDYARALFSSREELIGSVKYTNACNTLGKKTDELIVVQWILDFLKN